MAAVSDPGREKAGARVVLDPNVQIQESKVGSCDIQPGRRPRGEALLRLVAAYQSRAGSTPQTGNARLTKGDR